MSNNYIVYMHRNKVDGRAYIGLTGRDPKKRWRNGNGYRGEREFFADIKAYGWDAFTHEVIAANLTMEEAAKIEKELIEKYETTNPGKGYNVKPGGTCGYLGKHHSDETKKLLSEKCSGWRHTEDARRKISEAGKGRIFTPEQCQRISESQKGKVVSEETRRKQSEARLGKEPWNKGEHWSEEQKRVLSIAHSNSEAAKEAARKNLIKARKNGPWNRKKVLCVETGRIWLSATDAAKYVGGNQSSLSEACRIPGKIYKGYHWEYMSAEVS